MRRHTALVTVLGLYVVLSFAYAWRIPIMEGADELGHALYIDHVVRTRSLPEIGSDWEAVQPPLYYLVAGVVVGAAGSPRLVPETLRENPEFDWAAPVVARVFDGSSYLPADARPARRLRLLSSLFGFGTLILIYATALRASGGRRRLALGAAALPALTPQFVHHHAVISNDSLATLVSALLTYQLVAALSGSGSTIAAPKAMGFIAGLGVLTKYSVLPVAAAVFFGLMLLSGTARDRLRRASTFAGVALATCGAWLIWNTARYGDPLAQAAMRRAHAALAVEASIADLVLDPSFLTRVFKSYWGMLGSMVVPLHDSVYVAFSILTVVGGIGALLAFKQRTVQRYGIVALCGVIALTAIAFLIHNTHLSAGQGRLLFAALPAISVLLAAGWAAIWDAAVAEAPLGFDGGATFRIVRDAPVIALILVLLAVNVQTLIGPVEAAYHSAGAVFFLHR